MSVESLLTYLFANEDFWEFNFELNNSHLFKQKKLTPAWHDDSDVTVT